MRVGIERKVVRVSRKCNVVSSSFDCDRCEQDTCGWKGCRWAVRSQVRFRMNIKCASRINYNYYTREFGKYFGKWYVGIIGSGFMVGAMWWVTH